MVIIDIYKEHNPQKAIAKTLDVHKGLFQVVMESWGEGKIRSLEEEWKRESKLLLVPFEVLHTVRDVHRV